MYNPRHACLKDILRLFEVFEGKCNKKAIFCGDIKSIFMRVEAVDEGKVIVLDLMLIEEVLKVYFLGDCPIAHFPLDYF